MQDVMTFLHADDKRGVFVYPWEGTTVVGTTDLDHSEDLDVEASISEVEVDYLLKAFNTEFPKHAIKRSDILSTWAGVRPVIGTEKSKDPSKERRDHAVWSDHGLITVTGGKLTTFRLIALDALTAAKDNLPPAQDFSTDKVFIIPEVSSESLFPENPSWGQRLLGRYGERAIELVNGSSPEERVNLGDTEFTLAECRWALEFEAVEHLDDLLLRRTRLGMCLPNGGAELYPVLQEMCSNLLGWDEGRWNSELNRYEAIWKKHYSLPSIH
jgi:glycerol-3-phosphate dehydrogenase